MKNFLGFLSLKVGVNLLVSTYLTQAFNSLLVNITELNYEFPHPWLFCIICNIYSLIVWIIVFHGTYKESITLIRLALNMWIIYTIIWLISTIFSVTNNLERYVCVCLRCSESLWLLSNHWHRHAICFEHSESFNDVSRNNHLHFKTFRGSTQYNTAHFPKKHNKSSKNEFGYVTFSIAFVLIYFTIGIITLSSYLKELKCKEKRGELEMKCITSSIPQDNQNNKKVFKTVDICKDPQT